MDFKRTTPGLLARHRQLSPTAAVRVSPLCLGTMTFGDAQAERYGKLDNGKDTAFEILDHFYSQGGNFIDTANFYRHGESEAWLGDWLDARQNRDDIVLATKYTGAYMAHDGSRVQTNYGGNGVKSMKLSLDHSLKAMRTGYIDLFYVHWWDFTTSIVEVMHALNDLVAAGKVLYLGISDSPAWVVSKANQYARDHGLRQFSVYQGMWSAGFRDFERDIIPMCRDEGMGLCPYGTLGQGRFQTEAAYKKREESGDGRKSMPLSEHDKSISRHLEAIGNRKETNLHAIALAYCMQKAPFVFPIVGCRSVHHLQNSIDALAVRLDDEDVAEVDDGYAFRHGFPHEFLSGSLYGGDKSMPAQGPSDVYLTRLLGSFDWVEPVKPIRAARSPSVTQTGKDIASSRSS